MLEAFPPILSAIHLSNERAPGSIAKMVEILEMVIVKRWPNVREVVVYFAEHEEEDDEDESNEDEMDA